MSRELANVRHAPFPVQNWLTGQIKRAAAAQANPDLTSLWAGQSAPLIHHTNSDDLITAIVRDVDAVLR
jgi:nitronate monooxygenase